MSEQVSTLDFPCRRAGVELVGRSGADGFTEQQWLLCVDGSRYMHVTERLYHLLSTANGERSVDEIARLMNRQVGDVELTGDHIRWLLRERLVPAGLVEDGAERSGRRTSQPRPVLAIRHRIGVLPYRLTAPVAERLQVLYWWPVVIVMLTGAVVINVWLYTGSALRDSALALLEQPEWLLVLLGLSTLLALWHEFGHASAMRRARVPYGEIGLALYVVVPVAYTDVTHAYRLPRRDRLRVDLGGMYFSSIGMIALFATYWVTHHPVLLAAIVVTGLNILGEFTPYMRYDGYYVLADIIGVPEPFSLFRPLVSAAVSRRKDRNKRLPVRRRVKVVLWAYLLVLIAFLLRPGILLVALGWSVVAQIGEAGFRYWINLHMAWQAHDAGRFGAATIGLAAWSLIPIGLALFFVELLRPTARAVSKLVGWLAGRVRGRRRNADAIPTPVAWDMEEEKAADENEKGKMAPEQAIERIGSRYLADLAQALVTEIEKRYEERLTAKDREINERAQAAERDREQLEQHIRRLEQELETRTHELEEAVAHHKGDLKSLSQELLNVELSVQRRTFRLGLTNAEKFAEQSTEPAAEAAL
jgi:putative peptide zinc metalloprotease protein